VTQAFNTTTSIGRLTLNVLLSFAQFEREVTGERIRDKIAASKAKGMWMGGHPPLGYDVRGRALHINNVEADIVRSIFTRYLEERNVYSLRDHLERDGVRSKAWTSRAGVRHGGGVLGKGALYHILKSRLYLGEIEHRDRIYPGQHEAIITVEIFDAVQQKLKLGTPIMPSVKPRGFTPLLLGKLFDDRGNAMTSAHANKKGIRYFYYVSVAHSVRKRAGTLPRVSAPKLDRAILDSIAPLLDGDWTLGENDRVLAALQRVDLSGENLRITLLKEAVRSDISTQPDVQVICEAVRIERAHKLRPMRGRRSILDNDKSAGPRVDRALVRAVTQARRWGDMLGSGEVASIQELAAREQLCPIYTGQLMPLAFLAPDLVEQILDGRHPARLSLHRLLAANLPLTWQEQRTLFSKFA
jgi:site-specific DNA recombinase